MDNALFIGPLIEETFFELFFPGRGLLVGLSMDRHCKTHQHHYEKKKSRHDHSTFLSKTTAHAAIPSSLPVKPSPSVVVAFTLTADRSTLIAPAMFLTMLAI